MAREILFKAKRIDNGEWVMGGSIIQFLDDGVRSFYMPQFNEKCICKHDEVTDDILEFQNTRFYKVDGETICQYTGLTDKKGNKIWENDVVKTSVGNALVIYVTDAIYFNKYNTGFIIRFADDVSNRNYRHDLAYWIKFDSKNGVIGNIFDNPELLVATTGGAE